MKYPGERHVLITGYTPIRDYILIKKHKKTVYYTKYGFFVKEVV